MKTLNYSHFLFTLSLFLFESIQAQHCYIYGNYTYMDSSIVINSFRTLPPPPKEGSLEFVLDKEIYWQSKKERDTPRGNEAIEDAFIRGDAFISRFSKAFGVEITKDDMPELYKLLMCMKETAATLATWQSKEGYKRVRPFVYYHEPSLTSKEDSVLAISGSYPSGHATLYFAVSLVLQEINPERQSELMKCAYEKARSRLIVGAHWKSDIDAGFVMAAAVVAQLHSFSDFEEQLLKAKKEFINKSINQN